MSDSRWDPQRYDRFRRERERPAHELLARVAHAAPRRAWDLGCGTGAMACEMRSRWPAADVVGVDHSAEMLERAHARAGAIRWVRADLATWEPDEPADVV